MNHKINFEKDSATKHEQLWNLLIVIHKLFVSHFQNLEIFAVYLKIDQKTLTKSARLKTQSLL